MKDENQIGIAKVWLSDDLMKNEDIAFLKALLKINGTKIENEDSIWKIEIKGLKEFKSFFKDFTFLFDQLREQNKISEEDYDCIMFYNDGFDYEYATFQKFYATAEILIREK